MLPCYMDEKMHNQIICVSLIAILCCFLNETTSEPSVVYLGCFEDGGPSNRLMAGHHKVFKGTLTPEKCNEHCQRKGFAYAGTENSFECFCSKTKPPAMKKRLESECNSKCAGDQTKHCGGVDRIAIFSTAFPNQIGEAEEVLDPIGCFKDSHTNRLLTEYRQDFPGLLTNQKCVGLCVEKGYHYAGTEYGRECYCGNRKPSFKKYASDEECFMNCEGDSNQLCGAGYRIYVFKTSKASKEETPEAGKYIGCYKDLVDYSRSLDGHMEDFGGFLTPFKCTGLCFSFGFLYSGTQSSYQCFCGDKPPNPISKVAEGECNTPCTGDRDEMCGGKSRNSIRETGIPDLPVEGKYLGCFQDVGNQIYIADGIKLSFEKTNSPKRCMNYCSLLGYRYSGVEYGKVCFCGNDKPSAERAVNPEECDTLPCPGDPEERCGAKWRLAVYVTTAWSGGPITTIRPMNSLADMPVDVKYVGCADAKDNPNHNVIKAPFENTNNPKRCMNYCSMLGHRYSAIDHGNDCYCFSQEPRIVIKGNPKECTRTACTGDPAESCGASWRLAVYETTSAGSGGPITTIRPMNSLADMPVDVKYVGCADAKDNPNHNVIKAPFENTNNPKRCMNYCSMLGHRYSAIDHGNECYCGSQEPRVVIKGDPKECTRTACTGDPAESCGASWRLAVYVTTSAGSGGPITTIRPMNSLADMPVDVKYVGCADAKDNPNHNVIKAPFENTNNPKRCMNYCSMLGHRYSAIDHGNDCYCGSQEPRVVIKGNPKECTRTACTGDPAESCGASWRLAVYETTSAGSGGSTTTRPVDRLADSSVEGDYLGCYNDTLNQIYKGVNIYFENANSPKKCMNYCSWLDYQYAGVENGYECFCGNKKPSAKLEVDPEDCNNMPCTGDPTERCGGVWRLAVYNIAPDSGPVTPVKTVDRVAESLVDVKYIGCYNDTNNQIYSNKVKISFEETNSPKKCMNYCSSIGYHFSGVEYGKECFCGIKKPLAKLEVVAEECDMPCTGDPAERCGGDWRLAVHVAEAGKGDPVTPRPCVQSETIVAGKGSVCKGDVIFEDDFSSSSLGDSWNHVVMIPVPSESSPADEGIEEQSHNEDKPSDKPKETLTNVLETPETVSTTDQTHTSTSTRRKRKIEELLNAVKDLQTFCTTLSQSTVHDNEIDVFGTYVAKALKKLSSHDAIRAQEDIQRVLTKYMLEKSFSRPETQEFGFALLSADPENCFTSKNRLTIKPTFLNDTFVQSGHLQLNGCTGKAGTRQCEQQAASHNILPPVATARIHTRDSFSFRYGIVEIRAKLPMGDWLVPELWLEPLNHYYGPGYTSGRIRIAMNRGNSDYKCHEEDYGSNRLESGVVMGPSSNVQKRSLTTKLPDNWHDHFHNYTLIWKPDSISFQIDNGQAQELIPAGRTLCEVIGFKNDECSVWSGGSRIAPFDKDFYISLGLSVGNTRDFADDCKNRGKLKPFRNTDQKAMLKFWQDKENWKATWTEEHSSLKIEHIRVTAL